VIPTLQELVTRLESFLPALRRGRHVDPLANDIFEAVDDLNEVAHRVLAGDTRVSYPARVLQEQQTWDRLASELRRSQRGDVMQHHEILDIAEQILAVLSGVQSAKDGHHGFVKLVHETFKFLRTEYGFDVVSEEPTRVRYSSAEVYVALAWAKNVSSSCTFGQAPDRSSFWIDDLLFLYHDQRYKSLPQALSLDSESAIAEWVEFLASVFRQYGHAVLINRPGIFEELAAAQKARDADYAAEMDRRNKHNNLT